MNVLVPFTVWFPVSFTALFNSCATSYTCFSEAGFVPSFVGADVLFGIAGSVVNVFFPDML